MRHEIAQPLLAILLLLPLSVSAGELDGRANGILDIYSFGKLLLDNVFALNVATQRHLNCLSQRI